MSQENKINLVELGNTLNNLFTAKNPEPHSQGGTAKEAEAPSTQEKPREHCPFTPIELSDFLKEYILGQDDAIETVATKICTHFKRMSYEKSHKDLEPLINTIKSNILLIGPTGVGKTYLIKLIAHKLGVPFVKADATKFTETGYVGGDVEDLVRDLLDEAQGDIELAEHGIIYLDEIDKIASLKHSQSGEVSKRGVQHNLLKIMEESEVDTKNPLNISSQMKAAMQAYQTGKVDSRKINTKNILFVMSGAFQGLEEIIRQRLKHNALGFMQEKSFQESSDPKHYLTETCSEDLIEYGFESEFIGRLPIITTLKQLSEEELYKILKAPKNTIIESKKRDFKAYGIDIEFEDRALKRISQKAHIQKTGARSLASIVEKSLMHFEKQLPSTKITSLTVTEQLIETPKHYLQHLLTRESAEEFARSFQEQYSITLDFSPDAIEYIQEQTQEIQSTQQFLGEQLKNYGHGLQLAKTADLTISKELLENTEEYLDSLIKHSYQKTPNMTPE